MSKYGKDKQLIMSVSLQNKLYWQIMIAANVSYKKKINKKK